MPKDPEMEDVARRVLQTALKERGSFLLDRALKRGNEIATRMSLAGTINTAIVAMMIADAWLDGWIAKCEEEDSRAS